MSKRFVYVSLSKLSVCSCGHSALADTIQTGTRYRVDLESICQAKFHCGGCARTISIQAIRASQQLNPDLPMAYLPLQLFGSL